MPPTLSISAIAMPDVTATELEKVGAMQLAREISNSTDRTAMPTSAPAMANAMDWHLLIASRRRVYTACLALPVQRLSGGADAAIPRLPRVFRCLHPFGQDADEALQRD